MNKNIINKLFWLFWFTTTIFAGILAGFMISHILILGRFFNWYIESGNVDLLHATYAVYRETNALERLLYNSFLLLQLGSGIIWTVLAFYLKRERIVALIAGLATVWVSILFIGTGIGDAEDAVLSGTADASLTQLYVTLNIPIHTTFAIIYTVSFVLLLYVALKRIDLAKYP